MRNRNIGVFGLVTICLIMALGWGLIRGSLFNLILLLVVLGAFLWYYFIEGNAMARMIEEALSKPPRF